VAAAKTLSPAQLAERARNAGKSRTTPDYPIKKLVESAPSLTAEQAEQLRALLPASGS
jgi:hypothetical protein